VTGRAVRGYILRPWLNNDGPDKARERLEYTMQLLADGVMTPSKGAAMPRARWHLLAFQRRSLPKPHHTSINMSVIQLFL
jgi:hypothetical protein